MGGWYPIATHGLGNATHPGPGPYAVAFCFAIGVLLSTIPANLLLMARPLDGKPPVHGAAYWRAPSAGTSPASPEVPFGASAASPTSSPPSLTSPSPSDPPSATPSAKVPP